MSSVTLASDKTPRCPACGGPSVTPTRWHNTSESVHQASFGCANEHIWVVRVFAPEGVA